MSDTSDERAIGTTIRIIRKPEMLRKTGMSYPTIWQWMIDGTFPRSREVGGRVGWIESEVDDWIARRPIAPLKGDLRSKARTNLNPPDSADDLQPTDAKQATLVPTQETLAPDKRPTKGRRLRRDLRPAE